jgi:signal peptide peptidase SppA
MRFAHIYSRITTTPWHVDESTLIAITNLLQTRINQPRQQEDEETKPSAPITPRTFNGTQIIPLSGIIGKHLSLMESLCGGVDMEQVRAQFDAAQSDPMVERVLLHIDSPGGIAVGNHELFHHMLKNKSKPLFAFTDTVMGSAAYYIGAAADNIYATPTARVGSIGSYLVVRDISAALAREGVQLRVIRSGEFKGLGMDGKIDDRLVAALQADIDFLGGQFRADMSLARGGLKEEDMQGLAYFGAQALEKRLIDSVVPDLFTLLKEIPEKN